MIKEKKDQQLTNQLHIWRLTRKLKHLCFGKTLVIIHSAVYLKPPRNQASKCSQQTEKNKHYNQKSVLLTTNIFESE